MVFTWVATRDDEDFDDDGPVPDGNAVVLMEFGLLADAESPAASRGHGTTTMARYSSDISMR
jgi:hypothetical protein